MSCGCQVATAGTTGGVNLPLTALPGRSPLLGTPDMTGAVYHTFVPYAPATAAGQNGALAQNLGQTSAPATKKKTSGWLVAALAAGALVFL